MRDMVENEVMVRKMMECWFEVRDVCCYIRIVLMDCARDEAK